MQKWILFPGLRCVAMPGTVPRRAGLVSNLQPVALYSIIYFVSLNFPSKRKSNKKEKGENKKWLPDADGIK
jgi:hypothetical protein